MMKRRGRTCSGEEGPVRERKDLFGDVRGDELEAHGLHGALRRARNLSMPLRDLLRRVVALEGGVRFVEFKKTPAKMEPSGDTGRDVTLPPPCPALHPPNMRFRQVAQVLLQPTPVGGQHARVHLLAGRVWALFRPSQP